MKYKYIIFSLISILLLSFNGEAANAKFKVQFVVPPWLELANQVKSYGMRELRSLHDVEIIDEDPNLSNYYISLYPLLLKTSTGTVIGVAVSYVIEKDGHIEHAVLTGSPDQLKLLVEKIIATFDTTWLEQKRHK